MNSDCRRMSTVVVLIVVSLCACTIAQYPEQQVLLRDVQVLTLRQGLMTAGRRSNPVPQLKCVGGTAGCNSFVPQAVQCYNRGSDGIDVQWECKTDMDNAYRFGRTDVTCEGYSYPDDPYILKGSCGLEYTIDLTKEGHDHQRNSQFGGYYSKQNVESKSWGGAVAIIAMVIVGYIVYRHCLATPPSADDPTLHPHDRQPFGPPPPYTPYHDDQSSPPPPGFKPEHTRGTATSGAWGGVGGSPYGSGASFRGGSSSSTSHGQQYYSGSTTHTVPPQADQAAGGGFWTGAAAGGLLGYLFGSSNRGGPGNYFNQPHYPTGGFGGRRGYSSGWGSSDNSGWFSTGSGNSGGSFFSGGSSGSGSSSSSGTRTASGYGGTNRR